MPFNHVDAVAILDALVTETAPQAQCAVDRLGQDAELALMGAASMVAVLRRFDPATPPGAVRDFVAQVRQRFPRSGSRIKPEVMERIVRAWLGERGMLYGIDVSDLLPMMFLLVYAIMSSESLEDADKAQYFDTVIKLATGGGWVFDVAPEDSLDLCDG